MRLPNRVPLISKYFQPYYLISRRKKSSLGLWQEDISTDIKLKIENYWSAEVQERRKYCNHLDKRKLYYVLPMFPYPSGNLHMGHVRVYSISDTIARFHSMFGENVIHPIGWDSFGLPAENAAMQRGIPPSNWTNTNIATMKQQLIQLGYNFDWDKEISTCEPAYYKWTQLIFLKLLEKGLAYQSKALVNWDPVDKTVLADEQVDEMGCSWRSGAKVEKKILTQWFVRTTKYAKKLYDGLESEKLENWKDIINLQKHWIGECDGAIVSFDLKEGGSVKTLDVWSLHPYKFLYGQFLTISSSHVLAKDVTYNDTTAVLNCVNPISGLELPVYIADHASYAEGRDVYIACPNVDNEDMILAKSLGIKVTSNTTLVNIEEENKKAIELAKRKNVGGYFVSSKLKDWLISRQRYWGTPIPIIHCPKCGSVPVPYEDLPVTLPNNENTSEGIQTLDKIYDWVKCKCPQCNFDARRETDTMDTFVDSSWYYYRYLDSKNDNAPFDPNAVSGKVPVNIYIGGKEHAVLHLYYARFMGYFLHSLGWTPEPEPFRKLLVQGMIMGQSYKVKSSGKYIPPETVEKVGKEYKEKSSGEPVTVQWEKMSKSKHNGENPERLLSAYGCDTTRLLMLADVPPATSRNWSDATLPGALNFQHRLWLTIRDLLKHRQNQDSLKLLTDEEFQNYESKLWDSRNYFTATATYHFKHTQQLSVGISRLQSLTNTLRNNVPPHVISQSKEFELALAHLIIMLSAVTPHFCSELWAGFQSAPNRLNIDPHIIAWDKGVLHQTWPAVDGDYTLSFLCKVDGADKSHLRIKASELASMTEERALEIMLNEQSVKKSVRSDIVRVKYDLFPESRAILYIYTNRHVKKQKEAVAE